MLAVDTNVIVRLFTKDDEKQYQVALRLFTSENLFIADTVILEVEWVLRLAYEFEPAQICAAFRKLFGLRNVRVSDAKVIAQAIDWHESGLDFAESFHLALSQKAEGFKTFYEKFIKRAKNLSACKVGKP